MEKLEKDVCSYLGQPEDCSKTVLDWFVSFKDPRETWENEPSFLLVQIVVLVGVLLCYIHACSMGGRYKHWFYACFVVSVVVEMICYYWPMLNNFWHGQGFITFAGDRFPLYIVLIYIHMWYPAFVAATRVGLPWWAEPFLMGVLAVFIDLPYDIMGIKMLWWTWHTDDPSVYDRHYYVPWTSYMFHSSFITSQAFIFFGLRKLLMPSKGKFEFGNCILEWICTIAAGCLAMPVAAVVFIGPIYNTLHSIYNVHTEVCATIWFTLLLFIIFMAERSMDGKRKYKLPSSIQSLLPLLSMFIHFMFYIILVPLSKPEQVKSTGLHQMVGPCNVTEPTYVLNGPILRRKYLCLEDYDEPFDFHCVNKPPKHGDEWYTLCGTPHTNHVEYITYVTFTSVIGFLVYYFLLGSNSDQPLKPNQPSNTEQPRSAKPQNSDKKKRNKFHRD